MRKTINFYEGTLYRSDRFITADRQIYYFHHCTLYLIRRVQLPGVLDTVRRAETAN